MKGDIVRLHRHRMGIDGSGISTLILFYGCPLRCKYCANWYCYQESTYRESYTSKELAELLSCDDIYFKMTGGGIVFGGGEPLLQAEFIFEVCQITDCLWKKRVETSLYASWEKIEFLLGFIDEWIIDIKDVNPLIYKNYTKKENDIVLSNLRRLLYYVPRDKVLIRIPSIFGYNTSNDVKKSLQTIKEMGYTRINTFDYIL
ncbi:radical SAM protein [Selenomonas sp. AE3005]|uniref:radical SAM protein n=1 Tax=Selenomonas sp. AE3005 TaxID=1485543 RepID=UPI000485D235|nr:radical SAM protein [Selenomonas sp. AE3005]